MKYVGLYDNNKDIVTKEKLDAVEAAIPTKVSELTNDANYITAAEAPVQSVNGKAGAVTLSATDVSAIPSTLTGTAGQVLTKTADGQEWKDAAGNEKSVLLEEMTATMPSNSTWTAMTYGNGIFVAVAGGSNTVAYSTDGISWTQNTTLPKSITWTSITYGDGKFVAVAVRSDVSAYSTDGITWVETSLPDSDSKGWSSITYGNGKFVAVTTYMFAYSTNGINWTRVSIDNSYSWSSVVYGNGKFVAVADWDSSVVMYSTDGINWNEGTLPVSAQWVSVAYGNGKFVAITYSQIFAYSDDGINWTQGSLSTSKIPIFIIYGNGMFVISVGNSNIFVYSTDGVNWSQGTLPVSGPWTDGIYGNNKFVIIAQGETTVIYSTDGIHWVSAMKKLQYPDGTDIHEQVKEALQIKELPTVTTADNGQFLRVVNGAWSAETIANANGGSF